MTHPANHRPGTIAIAAVLDAVLVVVFVLIGRRSHAEGLDLAGIAVTAWPFLAALVVGWLAARAWRHPLAVWPTGVIVWAVTVIGGMLLRVVSGQGTQFAFIVVATLTLAAFLLGWRLVALLATRRGRARTTDAPRTEPA
ncbi:DUF3054 domain-containing protein [Agromyces cerinus]|uniref:DUF3054 domain-containing protein n=1 Tax=Agromyces cerinus subsp. cerinus TaxID=232089 RepID=A0A1N6HUL4_9MICO|nr:DUF3054 domain-containing protein [Agromyces cerinus]SIO23477.1 Protein of unknown function [Agromyces cerinus subsp. cerinus]